MSARKDALDRPMAALTPSPTEAIVAVLAASVALDGVMRTEEARRLQEGIGNDAMGARVG
jgi:hypothetical protein